MIKKLDKLILKAFIGPFIATFFISLFVLVMQFVWKYIDDLVGKGLDVFTIMRLMSYVTATAVPLALPLGILLASIMTFGNLGESFELVAIKSSGIPLLRFMRPLFFVTIFICGIAFLFANYVIPVANLKFNTLLYDITVSKPAFDIKEGVFYDKLEGYVIKIGKKEKDGATIRDVIIYERQYSLQDNIIIAQDGKMQISSDKKFLEFNLHNGWRYSERGNSFQPMTNEYIRMGFKDYKKVFDLSTFDRMKTPDSAFKDNYRMLNVKQLQKHIDSLNISTTTDFGRRIDRDVGVNFAFSRWGDTGWVKVKAVPVPSVKRYEDLIPDSLRDIVMSRSLERINLAKNSMGVLYSDYERQTKELRNHMIEWHRKFALSLACLVLFLIGAPLGSIIRKGGLGMPLVIAVIFFLIFHLLNMFGEKFVKQDVTLPVIGMWLSTLVLIPIGIFFTYKAMHDSNLFNQEFYFRTFRRVRSMLQKMRTPNEKIKPATA